MVKSAACYDVQDALSISDIGASLERYIPHIEETISIGGNEFTLGTWMRNIEVGTNRIFGTIERKEKVEQTVGDIQYPIPVQHSGDFVFLETSPLQVIVYTGRETADVLVLELESIVYNEKDIILKKRLSASDIQRIYISMQGGQIKVAAFRNLILPGLSKARISGPGVETSTDYARYKKFGDLTYLMFASGKYQNMTLSVNEDCQVTFYRELDYATIEKILMQEIL